MKLCSRLHPNHRIAKVCSQCGSHELSEPQPKVSWAWHLLVSLVRLLAGALLMCLSMLVVIAVMAELLTRPQGGMVVMGILTALLWCLWTMLPQWIRKLIRRFVIRREQKHEQ